MWTGDRKQKYQGGGESGVARPSGQGDAGDGVLSTASPLPFFFFFFFLISCLFPHPVTGRIVYRRDWLLLLGLWSRSVTDGTLESPPPPPVRSESEGQKVLSLRTCSVDTVRVIVSSSPLTRKKSAENRRRERYPIWKCIKIPSSCSWLARSSP